MRTTIRNARRDQTAKQNANGLPDGVGGTIAGGPVQPLDLMEILGRGGPGVSGGGAVSGAAQAIASKPGANVTKDRGFALSDGSRIIFASVDDSRVFADA